MNLPSSLIKLTGQGRAGMFHTVPVYGGGHTAQVELIFTKLVGRVEGPTANVLKEKLFILSLTGIELQTAKKYLNGGALKCKYTVSQNGSSYGLGTWFWCPLWGPASFIPDVDTLKTK